VWERQLDELGLRLHRFAHCVRVGVNLSMVQPLGEWNPFDVLFERDSDSAQRPDLTLLADTAPSAVAGRCIVRRQSSYRGRERHAEAIAAFGGLARRHDLALLDIDTMWARKGNGLNTAGQVLAALQRVDVLLTNRLHGMVYALKAGTPPLVIDAIEGTAKVAAQARRLGWPACVPVAQATPERLDETLLWCRSPEAREKARACAEGARADLESLHAQFLDAMASNIRPAPLPPPPGRLSRWLRTRRR